MRFNSQLNVDFNFLEHNYRELQKICSSAEIIFMVKADAYGHGIGPVVQFSFDELGNKEFGCASLAEALYLRRVFPERRFELYVCSDLNFSNKGYFEDYINFRIRPVISSLVDLEIFLQEKAFANAPLNLKFNTGMNRLGIAVSKVDRVIGMLKQAGRKSIDHLMSHFACASLSMNSNSHNLRQIENWALIKKELQSSGIGVDKTSIANSGAIEQGVGIKESHVRPGLMLYGPSSLMPNIKQENLWQGKIISSLDSQIIHVDYMKKGTPVGYGANPLPAEGVVLCLSLGYGDGIGTNFQNATIRIKQSAGKIVGRVNMDLISVLVEGEQVENFKNGEIVKIWDHCSEDIMRLSKETNRIPYELFCGVTNRVPRKYRYKN